MPSTIETTAMRNMTPIMTPMSVKKLFSFWTRIWARARRTVIRKGKILRLGLGRSLVTQSCFGCLCQWLRWAGKAKVRKKITDLLCDSPRPVSPTPQALHRQPHLLHKRRPPIVTGDDAVAQDDDTTRVRRDVGFVRDHDHRLPMRPGPRTRS